jgi:hypothetical protein
MTWAWLWKYACSPSWAALLDDLRQCCLGICVFHLQLRGDHFLGQRVPTPNSVKESTGREMRGVGGERLGVERGRGVGIGVPENR